MSAYFTSLSESPKEDVVKECMRQEDEVVRLTVKLAEREVECEKMKARLWKMREWTDRYGEDLCPTGADTYGEGVRACKQQVASILHDVQPPTEVKGGQPSERRSNEYDEYIEVKTKHAITQLSGEYSVSEEDKNK